MKDLQAVTSPERETDELIDDLAEGRIGFHRLPSEFSGEEQVSIRRRAMERRYDVALPDIGQFSLDADHASTRNCENMIGAAQIPIGVIGPLRIRGEHVHDEEVHVPLATTEGALVASANRGCRAITAAGGAVVRVEDVGITRAPVFRTSGIEQTASFLAWVAQNEAPMREALEGESDFLRLVDIRPQVLGTTVFLRFRFTSGDAMGMNMATIALDRVVAELIEPATGVECVSLSGNYCVDKKPAYVNFQEGRGKRVFAEVTLDKHVLERVLKTNARALVEVQYRKNLIGSTAAGSLGYNAHYANILAAVFIATGQDPAQVVEGALGMTCIEHRGPEGVIATVTLPDLPLAAIGGGTVLGTQRQALDLLGVHVDPENPGSAVMRLAEIVGCAVLAGELSLMAALTSRDLARAHEQLARGRNDA